MMINRPTGEGLEVRTSGISRLFHFVPRSNKRFALVFQAIHNLAINILN
jgi:hypothetical protein